jgi:hypothetical protein
MAAKKSSKVSTFVWVLSFLFILLSIFVLSGKFGELVTTITKSSASKANPDVSQVFADAFKADTVNTDKWTVVKTGDATVNQTVANNLRIDIPVGSVSGNPKVGRLEFKEQIGEGEDFRVISVVYRPVVTGQGVGITGLRFNSTGGDNDEGSVLSWSVNGASSKVSFVVIAADNSRLINQTADLVSNVAVFRMERVKGKYRAFYKPGNDVSGDTNWIPLGTEIGNSTGKKGNIFLVTNNGGVTGKFPKVAGRFDQVNIWWKGAPTTNTSFKDAFANGNLGTQWKDNKSAGVQVYENVKDNLIMAVPSGAMNNLPKYALLNRQAPTVPTGKDFTMTAALYKPTVVGEGRGYAGLRFVSAGATDDEAASVRWLTGTGLSKVVFVVRAPDGSLAERSAVDVPVGTTALTIRLVRIGTNYRGWYRIGDADADWKPVGKEESSNFGATGTIGLIVSNMGHSGKFPRVVGRFDSVSGSVAK